MLKVTEVNTNSLLPFFLNDTAPILFGESLAIYPYSEKKSTATPRGNELWLVKAVIAVLSSD